MKKILPFLLAFVWTLGMRSQCVYTCSNYAVSPISYSLFPTAGNNPISLFSPNTDDGITAPLPIGFNFDYYCYTCNQILICTNGFMQFNIGPNHTLSFADPAQSFPNSAMPNGIVALNMNDFDPGVGGTITYTTIGTSPNQMFILTYSNVPIWNANNVLNSGQIVLYETTNIIEIHTAGIGQCPSPGTQGIEDPWGSDGDMAPFRNNNTNWFGSSGNTAYRFAPYSAAPPAPISGNTLLCQGTTETYTTSLSPGATSYSWSAPGGWGGTSTTNTISYTAGASGDLSLTATYTCGTSTITALTVSVMPAPFVAITAVTPAVICSGKQVTISVSGATNYTLNPGNQTGIPPFIDTPMSNTVYSVTGISSQGCESLNTATAVIYVLQTPTITVNSGSVCLGKTFTINPSGGSDYTLSIPFNEVKPENPGFYTYSVVGTNTTGCMSAPVFSSLTVHPLPTVTAVANRTLMCIKETVTLTAGGALSYSWAPPNSTNTVLSVSPTGNITYSVTGTDANGCIKTNTISIKVNLCTGVGELNESGLSSISVYPNPSPGEYSIYTRDAVKILIYDLTGKIITEKDLSGGNHHLDIRAYAAGKYFLKVISGDSQRNIVLLKE
jgi:hypothetical protein